MLTILLAHLIVGIGIVAVGDRLGRRAFAIAALPPLAAFVWMVTKAGGVLDGTPVVERASWVSDLGLRFDLRIDGLSLLMVLMVSGIGVLIFVYSLFYFSHPGPGSARLAGLLTIFAGAMTGLVTADHVAMLFFSWEATSIVSYLLIGNNDQEPRARAAALQALLITGAGGLVMLAGLIILGQQAGSGNLSDIVANAPTGALVSGALVCVLVGAFTKSAQQPFGSWLPGAMVAPTPVSAYLHSATMVKAGVYLIARLAPAFAGVGSWRVLCVTVGLTTMIIGGYRALRQTDLKLLLAMGTVSQLGLLVVLFGIGLPHVTEAAVAMLIAHAVFKSALFMVVGIVDHESGTRDVRELQLDGARWRVVKVVAALSAASMAGVPLLLGFIAKELAIDSLIDVRHDYLGGVVVLVVVLLGSVLTFAYSARFVLGVFGRLRVADPTEAAEAGHDHDHDHGHGHAHDGSLWPFAGPAVLLTALSVLLGVYPDLLSELHRVASQALFPGTEVEYLALWHGLTPALGLSALVIASGVALVVLRRQVAAVQRRQLRGVSTERAYLLSLRLLNRVADRVTAVVQSGSLPLYVGVILTTAALVPTAAFLLGDGWPGLPDVVDVPLHIPIAVVMMVGAVAAAALRRRFAAVLMLGSVGYAMAAFFVAQGAPDLALTQFAIETLSLALFVLVLRALPDEQPVAQPGPVRVARGAAAAFVGVFVFVFAIATTGSRVSPPISQEFIDRAVPEGKGGNVVNVILVDFRGLDTLGEITVLVVAAVGALGLARSGRTRPADTVLEEAVR